MPEDDQERGFRVIDRRGREEEETSGEATAADAAEEATAAEAPGEATAEAPREAAASERELAAIDFSTFLLSLATSALYHLGMVEDPETGAAAEPNLPLARQTIDTLALLEEKTTGNLTEEEAKLLQTLLYDLRMHYVQASR